MAGKLSYSNSQTASTVDLYYEPSSGFSTGTLYAIRKSDGVEISQAVSSGSNTFSGLSAGYTYSFYVFETGDTRISNIVTVSTDESDDLDDRYWTKLWISDGEDEWQHWEYPNPTVRARTRIDTQGHWLRWRLHCSTPGHRMVIRNITLKARMKGNQASANQQ